MPLRHGPYTGPWLGAAMFRASPRVSLLIGIGLLVGILVAPGFVGGEASAPSAPRGQSVAPAPDSSSSVRGGPTPVDAVRSFPALAVGRPDASYIDPYALIDAEPAPMGIADFGVTGTSGNVEAYSYASPVWQGNVQINDLNAGTDGYMTFQLNLMLVLTLGTTNYTYWTQDVASMYSPTGAIGFIDNIWNFSAGTSGAGGPIVGDVSGNGSAGSDGGYTLYADSVGSGYPGAGVDLAYPTNLSVRLVDSTIAGYPHVAFEYNDGYGWVTYDNVTFLRMHAAVNVGFLVDGFSYEPIGAFYDAEWVFCGSGSGQRNVDSDLDMSSEYWNGHNFEAPSNAFNFGSDTAESLDNVISSLGAPPANGSLYSTEINGSGSLGLLYNSSMVSTLDVATPNVTTGEIAINGSAHDYRGGAASFTLAPGVYNVSLWSNGSWMGGANVTLAPGTTTHLLLPPPRYVVQFEESGLPLGTHWQVTVDGQPEAAEGPLVNFSLFNGTYRWALTPVPGFSSDTYGGTLPVEGFSAVIALQFVPFTYAVTFAEFNLPAGTTWSISTPGATRSTQSATLTIPEPNGTFQFNVSTLYIYEGTPSVGNITIAGASDYQEIEFGLRPGTIAGSVLPIAATILVDGSAVPLTNGTFVLGSELPGSYTVEAELTGYATAWKNLTVTAGNVSRADFTLVPVGSGGSGHPGSTGSSGSSGFTTTDLAVVLGVIVLVGAVAAVWLLHRTPRRRSR